MGQIRGMQRAGEMGLVEQFRTEVATAASVPLPGGGETAENRNVCGAAGAVPRLIL